MEEIATRCSVSIGPLRGNTEFCDGSLRIVNFNNVEAAFERSLDRRNPAFLQILNVLLGQRFGLRQLLAVGNVARAVHLVWPTIDLRKM